MSVFSGLRKLIKGMMKSDNARQASGNLGDAVAKQQLVKKKEIYGEADAKGRVARAEANISNVSGNDKDVVVEEIAKQQAEVEAKEAHGNVISQGKVLDTLERIKSGDINNMDSGVLRQVLSSDVDVAIKDEIEGAGEMLEAVKEEEALEQDQEERAEEKAKEKKKMEEAAEAEFAQANAEATASAGSVEATLTNDVIAGLGEAPKGDTETASLPGDTTPTVADTPTVPASAAMPLPGMGGPTPMTSTPDKPEEVNK